MLSEFTDFLAHPEEYRMVWRDGELYIEPIIDPTGIAVDTPAAAMPSHEAEDAFAVLEWEMRKAA